MSKRPESPRGRLAGLALVELLVALVVLAVVLTAGWRAAAAASDRQALVRDRILAQWVAQDALARLRAQRLWPAVGNRQYESTQGGRLFLVREQVTTTPNPAFRQVRLRVQEAGDGSHDLAELVGFVRQPVDGPGQATSSFRGRDGDLTGRRDEAPYRTSHAWSGEVAGGYDRGREPDNQPRAPVVSRASPSSSGSHSLPSPVSCQPVLRASHRGVT